MLLTRPPVGSEVQAPQSSRDLHVLSTPPAFVLSQDQTLHLEKLDTARLNVVPFEAPVRSEKLCFEPNRTDESVHFLPGHSARPVMGPLTLSRPRFSISWAERRLPLRLRITRLLRPGPRGCPRWRTPEDFPKSGALNLALSDRASRAPSDPGFFSVSRRYLEMTSPEKNAAAAVALRLAAWTKSLAVRDRSVNARCQIPLRAADDRKLQPSNRG